MKFRKRLFRKTINAAFISCLYTVTGVYSCATAHAQSLVDQSASSVLNRFKNAGREIRHAETVNLGSHAEPLHQFINSPYEELKPSVSPSGDKLYFSRHKHPDNGFGEDDLEDIWYANFNATDNTWSHPVLLTGHLNNAGPNYVNNVSSTGDTIILGNRYLKRGKMGAGLSYSVNIQGQWSHPTPIHIQDEYNISEQANFFVGLHNGVIISAVQRIETHGSRDLYISFWDGTKASTPINMGAIINTPQEESSPFLASDNRTLYFASKGHHGYGGFDIFVTSRLDESWLNWSEPENLGPAVNGQLNEEHFTIARQGDYAFFSKQVTVHNVDLYRIHTEDLFVKPVAAKVTFR